VDIASGCASCFTVIQVF